MPHTLWPSQILGLQYLARMAGHYNLWSACQNKDAEGKVCYSYNLNDYKDDYKDVTLTGYWDRRGFQTHQDMCMYEVMHVVRALFAESYSGL